MAPGNFNWFLHSLLFLHTERVIKIQREKASRHQDSNEEDDMDEDLGIDIDRE
jgi:hypothetical protein